MITIGRVFPWRVPSIYNYGRTSKPTDPVKRLKFGIKHIGPYRIQTYDNYN